MKPFFKTASPSTNTYRLKSDFLSVYRQVHSSIYQSISRVYHTVSIIPSYTAKTSSASCRPELYRTSVLQTNVGNTVSFRKQHQERP